MKNRPFLVVSAMLLLMTLLITPTPTFANAGAPGSASTQSAAAAETTVIHVPRDYATIQEAVNAAPEDTIIQVAPGVYSENVVVTKSGLRLHAADGVILHGNGAGIGIHVLGTAQVKVNGVDVSGFEVRNFNAGIVVESASQVRVHHNDVHDNLSTNPSLPLGDATGIELRSTADTEVSENFVHHNGARGIQGRLGSHENLIRGNRVEDNGFQFPSAVSGAATAAMAVGIGLTGANTNGNRLEANQVNNNNGWGIQLSRPPGSVPITKNLVLLNRAHGNQRSGIAVMFAAKGNFVLLNDARDNNFSGLAPCVHCNLVDLSTGAGDPNVFESNQGTFNLTDPACLTP